MVNHCDPAGADQAMNVGEDNTASRGRWPLDGEAAVGVSLGDRVVFGDAKNCLGIGRGQVKFAREIIHVTVGWASDMHQPKSRRVEFRVSHLLCVFSLVLYLSMRILAHFLLLVNYFCIKRNGEVRGNLAGDT